MKYFYKNQIVKRSKVMDYKFTILSNKTNKCSGAYTSYENATSHLKGIAKSRAEAFGITIEEAINQIGKEVKIVEFTKIEA